MSATLPEQVGSTEVKVQPKEGYTYEFREVLEPDEIAYWWTAYEAAFHDANISSPEKQTMSRDEFTAAMTSRDITKLAVSDEEGIAAMTVYGDINNPDIFSWLSQDYFAHHYPEHYDSGRVQYFVATLSRPGVRDMGFMGSMGQSITDRMIEQFGSVSVIYDCCEENSWLPEALHGLVGLTLEKANATATPLQKIGAQVFYAFQMSQQGQSVE